MTKKAITHQQYLQALGLFTLATTHYRKMRECEFALIDLLGYEDREYGDKVSDAIYNNEDFDKALALDQITVASKQTKTPG